MSTKSMRRPKPEDYSDKESYEKAKDAYIDHLSDQMMWMALDNIQRTREISFMLQVLREDCASAGHPYYVDQLGRIKERVEGS